MEAHPLPSAHGRMTYFPTRDLIHTIFAPILKKNGSMDFSNDNNKTSFSVLNNISMLIFSMLITNSINTLLRSLLFIFVIINVVIVKTNRKKKRFPLENKQKTVHSAAMTTA